LRDEHRIVLHPGRVVAARVKRELSRHGLKRHVLEMHEFPCEAPGNEDLPWAGALKALDAAVPALSGGRSYASVILSNHFMRYALVPWSDALSDAKEEIAYAQHSFSELYGRDGGEWELRISRGRGCMPQMASAVDRRLLGSLRESLERAGIGLKSIQPHLMQAYNACHAALRGRSAWLALVEDGNLCLALLQKGHWSWVRSMRIGSHWLEELPRLLEREAFNADVEAGTDEVLLWAPEHDDVLAVTCGRWKIRQLQPALMPSLEAGIAGRFAPYMSE
jgi:hypothetical protein